MADDDILTLLTQDLIGDIAPPGAQWGVFSGGGAVITADTVLSLGYKQEWSISDYPVERGSFESYDKVALPFDARVRFAAGGSATNREALLSSIAAIAGTTQVFDVVTPEFVYTSATISHYDYQRTSHQGLGLLQVDVWLLQVIQQGNDDALGGASQPDGAPTVNGGSVQTTDPSAAQIGAVQAAPDFNVNQSPSALP